MSYRYVESSETLETAHNVFYLPDLCKVARSRFALLIERHQAPITAALTPAFSADSTPEILSSAVHACAVFVGCGVVKDVSRMGRILKLLTVALEQSKGKLSPHRQFYVS